MKTKPDKNPTPNSPIPASRPAVFIDRDGVILDEVEYPIDGPDNVRLLPGAAKALKRINDAGLPAILITNQAIVARGMVTEEGLAEIHNRMADLLDAEAGARLDAIYYCPHYPDPPEATRVERYCVYCDCRKPAPGLILRAANELNLDLARSVMIGDSSRDALAAKRAGVASVLLTETGIRGVDNQCEVVPDHLAADMPEAVEWALGRLH